MILLLSLIGLALLIGLSKTKNKFLINIKYSLMFAACGWCFIILGFRTANDNKLSRLKEVREMQPWEVSTDEKRELNTWLEKAKLQKSTIFCIFVADSVNYEDRLLYFYEQ
jgi:hypothetical protein